MKLSFYGTVAWSINRTYELVTWPSGSPEVVILEGTSTGMQAVALTLYTEDNSVTSSQPRWLFFVNIIKWQVKFNPVA